MNYATAEGTYRFRARFAAQTDASHFERSDDLYLSSLGIGTYLGEADDETSQRYAQAITRALALSCNVIDTASNYRFQLSERAIGQALQSAGVARDEIFISTKGGYVPYDGSFPSDPARYITETFVASGIAQAEDFAQSGQHCMAPRYLAHQLAQSRQNLQLDTLDLYYIYNPEGQLGEISRDQFYKRLLAAFEFLEKAVADGYIRRYGTATWNGYRQLPSARDYLSLGDMLGLARAVAGDRHHFKAIQLPINLAMPEALENKNQLVNEKWQTALDAARELGVMVFASASLLQARLSRNLPGAMRNALGKSLNDAQRALQFTRSLPGVTCALVGMSTTKHVEENLQLARQPRFTQAELKKVLG